MAGKATFRKDIYEPLPYLRCDFASVSAFDRHRVGIFQYTHAQGVLLDPPREDGRRCMDESELLEAGLALDGRGRWSILADAARARAAFANAA